jgi:hypothetical protein
MKNVHLVIADLFLPEEFAACAGLHLPFLEKMLARGVSVTRPAVSIEELLCGLFGVQTGVANISAAFDGLGEGCWLRADPVHLRLQREQVVLLPNVALSHDEAQCFCASLNEHFADQGMEFFAPHPDRWYVKLNELPDIVTVPLSQAAGRNIHGNLPGGADARRLNQIFNEIQMLLFAHPLNEAREKRKEVPVNSVWLWGNGQNRMTTKNDFGSASSDEVLVQMLAASANIPFSGWSPVWCGDAGLLVWGGLRSALQRGDLAAWRDALQEFETGYARPLWQALRRGQISQLQIDIPGGDGMMTVSLTRAGTFAFWRRARKLSGYSVPSTRE